MIFSFGTWFAIWWSSALTCVSFNHLHYNNGSKIQPGEIIWIHRIVKNIAVNTGYIHQVEKYAQIKISSWFLIQTMICNSVSN